MIKVSINNLPPDKFENEDREMVVIQRHVGLNKMSMAQKLLLSRDIS
jgi:hypothetical protein